MRPTEDGWDEAGTARRARLMAEDETADILRERWQGWTVERCNGGWLAMWRRTGEQVEGLTLWELDSKLAGHTDTATR